jgi:NADH:ubiquinone oxidoreductase subunit D
MDDRFDRLDIKIDKIQQSISSIDQTLAKQSVILEDHTRRSLANEKAVETLKTELKPVFSNVTIMNFLGKLAITMLGSGLIWEIVKWLVVR